MAAERGADVAIEAVGLYVPGGTAAYPSSVLMNAVPARVAGVPRVVMVVPAPDGKLNPLVLAADPDRLRLFYGTPEPERSDTSGGPTTVAATTMTAPEAVRSQLASVLDVDSTMLDLDSSLFDLGVDSLLALDLRKRLTRLTGRTVPLARLLGGITGTDLIAELSEKVDTSRD